MKANAPSLFPNVTVATRVIEYAADKSNVLPEPLLQYHAKISELERSNMSVSTFQGQALSFLAKLAGAKRGTCRSCVRAAWQTSTNTELPVLEIGVFRGFSSMVW